jgi:iron complex outermembrane receptor protein
VLALYPNGYRPVTHGDQSDVSVVAGVRIASGGWNWDLSARHGGNIFRYDLSNSANASLGAQSPTSFHLASFDYRQDALNADLTRELNLGGVPVNLAIGAEYSRETYTSSPGDAASYAAGPITDAPPGAQAGPGLRPQDAFDGSRHLSSVYADIESDLSKNCWWARPCATRTTAISAAPAPASCRRATSSASSSCCAARSRTASARRRWCRPASASTLNFNSDGSGLQTASLLPASDPLARAFGAQALKPEKSTNLSLGLAWKPARNTSFTLDGYRIKIKDRITRTSDLQSDAATAYLASIGRSDIQSVAYLANLLDTTTSGLDAVLNHDLPLAGGKLNLSAALNLNHTSIDSVHQSRPRWPRSIPR